MGANWVIQTSGTTLQLNHVYGFTSLNVWAVGNYGIILYWNGENWTRQNSGTGKNLNRVWGFSTASVWACGAGGILLNSTNQGTTWNPASASLNAAYFTNVGSVQFPNWVAMWGSSALDFWVAEQSAGFFHTQDGGNTWSYTSTVGAVSQWNQLWGVTGNYIIAVGFTSQATAGQHAQPSHFGGPTNPSGSIATAALVAGVLGYFNGVGWTLQAEPSGSLDTYGAWPFGPSSQNYTVGQSGVSGIGTIRDWTGGFTSSVYDAVPTAQFFQYIYGTDQVNTFAVGQNGATSPVLAQVAPSGFGPPGVSGSWNSVTMPSGSPSGLGGFNAVYAGPSAYAVAVGANGFILARNSVPLAVLSASVVGTNAVQVTFSAPPLAISSVAAGDAFNPASWSITRTDTGAAFDVMAIVQVSPTIFNVLIYERWAAASITHQISAAGMLDPYGATIIAPTTATFQGVVSVSQVTQDAIAASNRYTLTDIANPPFPQKGTQLGGGVRIIGAAGDFQNESGNTLLTKLILRRLSITTGAFFYMPDYGLGVRVKELVLTKDMVALKKKVEDQVAQEPEVEAVNASLMLDAVNEIIYISLQVRTNVGQLLTIQTQQSTAGISL